MPLKLRRSSPLIFLKGTVHGEKAGVAHGLGDLLHGLVAVEHGFGSSEPHMLNGFIDPTARILLKDTGGIGGRNTKY